MLYFFYMILRSDWPRNEDAHTILDLLEDVYGPVRIKKLTLYTGTVFAILVRSEVPFSKEDTEELKLSLMRHSSRALV